MQMSGFENIKIEKLPGNSNETGINKDQLKIIW